MAKKTITTVQKVTVAKPKKQSPGVGLVGTKIACPNHPLYEIKIQQEGNRLFALDTCPTRGNLWQGQPVWETTISEEEAPPTVEENPTEG